MVEKARNRGSVRIKKITRNKTRKTMIKIVKEGIKREKIRNQGRLEKTSKTRLLMMSVKTGQKDAVKEEEIEVMIEEAETLT